MILTLVIGELKEPFIGKTPVLIMISTIMLIEINTQSNLDYIYYGQQESTKGNHLENT